MRKRSIATALLARLIVVALALVGGCAQDETPRVRLFECPTPAGSAEPNLHVRENRLYVSWLHHGETGHAFQYALYEDGAWRGVRTIVEGERFFANWADVPSIVELSDGSLVAHWLQRNGDDPHGYDALLAVSHDGTRWSTRHPHRDGTATQHGFVSIAADDRAGAAVVWLDGRNYAGGKGEDEAEMQLMWCDLSADGCAPEAALDTRVCSCCPTSVARTATSTLVAYRDRSPSEVRDISLVRRENGAWSEPYALADDGWQISGCPVNGPALAADGERVAAARFTLGGGEAAVRLSFSRDEGRTFPVDVRVDDGNPLGRSDVVLLPRGDALVLWIESPPEGAVEIRARRVAPDGHLDDSFLVSTTSPERASGFPRMERIGNHVYFAWTEVAEPTRVRMATLELPRPWR
ncbi:MAG: exo-alpha-sialidase [Candidatus Latescibacterota bacterium]|nr:MAG: exo-alpha-sialidase [Candidatus Latescibacterota bacterium]